MSLSGDILSDMQMDASIEAIGEIAGSINLDGSGSTPTITASATVSPDPGIPACNVVKTGTDEYPNFAFNFSGLKGEPGEQGLPGQNGQNGADGSDGITPNLTATASVGASTGTPAVTVTRIGTDENPNFYFQFDNLKGEQGIQGEQGEPGSQGAPGSVPNVSASASVTNTSGTPAVTVTRTGSDAAPNFDFAFENLKGEQGIQGVPGQNGQNGADGSDGVTPIVSATASADNSYGIPNVVVTRSGTDVAPSFDFAFHNIKGEPGTSGVPAGGATGQVLAKESNDDWDCDWQTLVIPSTAAEINFDNTGTGMTATDVQDAVTELKSNLTEFEPIDISDKFTTPFTKDYLKAFYYPQEKQVKVTFKITGCTTGSAVWLTIINLTDNTYKPIRDFMGVCYQPDTSKGMSTGVYMPNNTTTIQVFRISSNIGIYSGTFTYPID